MSSLILNGLAAPSPADVRGADFIASLLDPGGREFGDFDRRRIRYQILWAHYEGSVYRTAHAWAARLKAEYDLYPFTRTIFSPAHRIVEFWAGRLMGGPLDPEAGDGMVRPSALPIMTEVDALRPALARIWKDSVWEVNKENWTRFGAALGDTGLMVVDDPGRSRVRLCVIPPWTIRDLDLDAYGNCKGYRLEEQRPDPRAEDPETAVDVTFTEVATREGESVIFRTYLDDDPYDWRDYDAAPGPEVGDTWSEPYGFVPFVFVKHRDVGLGWGLSELHADLSKLYELDEQASKLNDQIRKSVDAKWFVSGATAEDVTIRSGRDKSPYLYAANASARVTPMVAELDVAAVSAHIRSILEEVERDHIELQADMATASGDASGRALRVARQRTEALVVSRRAPYDDALVRAHMMAVSIAAQKGYAAGAGFSPESYARGELAHGIGDRPVFAVDALDRLEEEQARATLVETLTRSGVPLAIALRRADYPEEEVAEALRLRSAEAEASVGMAGRLQAAKLGGDGGGNGRARQ